MSSQAIIPDARPSNAIALPVRLTDEEKSLISNIFNIEEGSKELAEKEINETYGAITSIFRKVAQALEEENKTTHSLTSEIVELRALREAQERLYKIDVALETRDISEKIDYLTPKIENLDATASSLDILTNKVNEAIKIFNEGTHTAPSGSIGASGTKV